FPLDDSTSSPSLRCRFRVVFVTARDQVGVVLFRPGTPPAVVYALSLHDALPISWWLAMVWGGSLLTVAATLSGAQLPWVDGKGTDRKSTRLNSSHVKTSYAVVCLENKTARDQVVVDRLRLRRRQDAGEARHASTG